MLKYEKKPDLQKYFKVSFISSSFLRKRIKGICEARGLSIEPVGSEISNKLARGERRHYFSGEEEEVH